jgi:hypothetical protein
MRAPRRLWKIPFAVAMDAGFVAMLVATLGAAPLRAPRNDGEDER